MVDPALEEQLLEDFEQLTPDQQKRAVAYVHSLRLAERADEGGRYTTYVRREIAAGLDDLDNGRTFSQDEIEALYPES
jgi:hypothetical protein